MKLRDYQTECDFRTKQFINSGGNNGIVVAPTGSGKSFLIANLCEWVVSQGGRVLVLAHVAELIEQNYEEFTKISKVNASIYCAGLGEKDHTSSVVFASIQSIYKIWDKVDIFDFIIIDECHLVPFDSETMYREFLNGMRTRYPHMRLIGYTATPYRLFGGLLTKGEKRIFTDIIHTIDILELIKKGYLCKITAKGSEVEIDTKGLHIVGGEFKKDEAEYAAMDITKMAIDDLVPRAKNRKKWLIFATSIKHANQIERYLDDYGIECKTITGKTPKSERKDIINDFKKSSRYRALINVNVLTTGFNVPSIDLIVFLRPTMSTSLYVQMVGRGARISEEKEDCLILDYAGNVSRFGPIDKVKIADKGESEKKEKALLKKCLKCQSFSPLAAKECLECGYIFPGREIEHSTAPIAGNVLSTDIEPEWIDLIKVELWKHVSGKGTKCIKIMYHPKDLFRSVINEFIFPESTGKLNWFYTQWCQKMGFEYPYPRTCDEFLDLGFFPVIRRISVIKDGKFDKVIDHDISGIYNHIREKQ